MILCILGGLWSDKAPENAEAFCIWALKSAFFVDEAVIKGIIKLINLDLMGRISNDLNFCNEFHSLEKEDSMLVGGGIIKAVMNKRGFKHRRTEDQFTLCGEYARNLQYVYSREYQTRGGLVVDLAYFSVDVLGEKLVIGLYRENSTIENGIYVNMSRALDLQKFTVENVNRELDKLITPVRDRFK